MNGQPSVHLLLRVCNPFTNHFPDIKVIRVDGALYLEMAFQSMIDSGLKEATSKWHLLMKFQQQ
jgi:putative Holliday junction resolvase